MWEGSRMKEKKGEFLLMIRGNFTCKCEGKFPMKCANFPCKLEILKTRPQFVNENVFTEQRNHLSLQQFYLEPVPKYSEVENPIFLRALFQQRY